MDALPGLFILMRSREGSLALPPGLYLEIWALRMTPIRSASLFLYAKSQRAKIVSVHETKYSEGSWMDECEEGLMADLTKATACPCGDRDHDTRNPYHVHFSASCFQLK